MVQMRGFAIRGLLRFGKQNGFPPAELVPLLSASVRPSFDTQIFHSGLYPYAAFTEPLQLLDRKLGKGDKNFAKQVGREAAREDVRGIFQFVALLATPERAIKRAPAYWQRYSDTGRMVDQETRKGYFRMAMEEFPDIDLLHCVLIEGWNEGGLLAVGVKSVEVHQSECVHRGDKRCVFEGTWQ
jgi:predicted hydrocarbon binding protein